MNASKYSALKFLSKLALSLTLLFFIFHYAGFESIYIELMRVKISYLLLSAPLLIFSMIFMAIRWKNIITIFKKKASAANLMKYTLISFAFGLVTPARLGEFIKVKYLSDDTGLSYANSLITILADKIFDVFASFPIMLIGFLFLKKDLLSEYSAFALGICILIFTLSLIYFSKFLKSIKKLLPKKYWKKAEMISFTKPVYIKLLCYSFLIWALYIAQAFFITKALSINASFYMLAAAVPAMAFSSLIPISIGGFGAREAIAIYLFSIAGIPPEKSAAFSILYTFIGLGIPAIIGGFLYAKKKLS